MFQLMRACCLFLALALAGCGGSYPAGAKEPAAGKASGQQIGVEAAALPFKILSRTGQEVATAEALAALASARAVCIGEQHSNPHHHWAQLELVGQLAERAGGRPIALGMEMVQRPHQAILDDYAAGKINAAALVSRTGWKDRWGYDFALYQPIIDRAVKARAALLALNVSKELRKRIRDVDLDGLTDAERAQVPELDLEDPQHKAWWDAIMAEMADAHGHGAAHGKDDDEGDGDDHDPAEAEAAMAKMYRAQVLWDETMADTASRWLAAGGDRMVIILAGNGHCHDSAIPKRIARRGHGPVLSVRPVIDTGDGEVADVLAAGANDYIFVMTMPEKR